jgi:hypothetical protein
VVKQLGHSERSLRIQGNSDEDNARPAKKQKTAHEDAEGEEKQGEEGGDKETHSPSSSDNASLRSPSATAPGTF